MAFANRKFNLRNAHVSGADEKQGAFLKPGAETILYASKQGKCVYFTETGMAVYRHILLLRKIDVGWRVSKPRVPRFLYFSRQLKSTARSSGIEIQYIILEIGGRALVKGLPEERAIRLAQYIIEQGATVRQAAAQFGISKSTVHKDITDRLEHLNQALYVQVQAVLNKNKCERHIRGGLATREKYREARSHREAPQARL